MDQCGIAEADVKCRAACHALQRGADCIKAIFTRLGGSSLHIGFVNLDDVCTRRKQIFDLGIDGDRIILRHFGFVTVKIILRLLRHGEGTGDGDLDHPVRIRAQKFDVASFNSMHAADFANDAAFANLNTPDDLAAAEAMMGGGP